MKLNHLPALLAVAVIAAVAVFVTLGIRGGGTLPSGPVEVVWDHEICAHCRMHVGEPAFAAQVQTVDSAVHNFDDPGCAFEWLAANGAEIHGLFFRHREQDRWIVDQQVAFVTVPQSPMGYGFAAVDAGTPGAVPLRQARDRMLQTRQVR